MKKSFFKDSLVNRLERNELTFDSFLEDPEVFLSIKRNSRIVTSFAVNHIEELLNYAIFGPVSNSKNNDLLNRAMKIISTNNIKIIYAICDNTLINSLARKVLSEFAEHLENVEKIGCMDNTNWECIIGRFASIIETCFNRCPENINNFRFLPKLLKLCDNIMIFSLFNIIVSSGREDVRSFLRFIKFQDILIEMITNWHNENNSCISIDGILAIYDILIKYVNNIGSDGCLPPSLVQFAIDFLPTNDRRVLAKQWKLANEAIDAANASDFSTLYTSALMAIQGENVLNIDTILEKEISYFPNDFHLFYKYQENALEFLSTLFSCYPTFASQIDGNLLVQTLVNVYEEFSTSSFALSAVCTLMLIIIEISEIQNYIIELFMPVIIQKIKDDNEFNLINNEKDNNYIESDSNDQILLDTDSNDEYHYDNTNSNEEKDSIINNDENDSIINYDDNYRLLNNNNEKDQKNRNKTETIEKNIDQVKNNAKKSSLSVNQRAFTIEFVKQVVEMSLSNDELKERLGEQPDFLEVCIPRICKTSSMLSNDYGGMCVIPNIIRYPSIEAFKPINLNFSVNI